MCIWFIDIHAGEKPIYMKQINFLSKKRMNIGNDGRENLAPYRDLDISCCSLKKIDQIDKKERGSFT